MHKKTLEIFKQELFEINSDIEIIGEYINCETRIKCKCKKCGNVWETIPRGLLQGTGCPECAKSKRGNRISKKDAIIKLEKSRPHLTVIGEYNGSHSPIKCFCKIHNIEFKSNYCTLLNKSTNCPECSKETIRRACGLSQESFLNIISNTHPHIIPNEKYINRQTEISFHCTVHNMDFVMKPQYLLYNKSRGCPKCSSSIGENKMVSILINMGFDVIRQYVFKDCKNINVLPFDAFVKEINTAFEYQGEQHYQKTNFNGANITDEEYEKGLKRDFIKEEYCKKNNINLIKVPYWELDSMEDFLYKQLQIQ